jgi:hypothetical protein
MRWAVVGPAVGVTLGALDSVVNHVPALLGEVGTARAERGGWSQVAEFASLILDAGWAWAATAVLVGWLASQGVRPAAGLLRGALAGGLALAVATTAYYGVDLLFDGGVWWGRTTRFWLIASVLLGTPLGVAGALVRCSGLIGTLTVLVVPAGAAFQMALLPPPSESRMAVPVQLTVWITSAVATALVVRQIVRRRDAASSAERS